MVKKHSTRLEELLPDELAVEKPEMIELREPEQVVFIPWCPHITYGKAYLPPDPWKQSREQVTATGFG